MAIDHLLQELVNRSDASIRTIPESFAKSRVDFRNVSRADRESGSQRSKIQKPGVLEKPGFLP
jgi:hypothetical protein